MKHVSNEEKATEIAAERKRLYFDSDGLIINSEVECYAAAEEMAQWKDEQEIEFLQSLMFQASTPKALNIIINNRIKLLKGE